MSRQHCENYDVKRETVHCYPRNVDRCCWNLSALFKICFRFVLLYNKSLNDWSLGEQWILFPSNLNVSLDFVSGNIEILGKQNSLFPKGPVIKCLLLYSWRFSRYSAPTHWLVHGHMTSNNETVSRQMPWAGNIAKTMTSNGKQFTVTREMLTAFAGISARYSKLAFVLFCYITNHLMTGPLGNSEFCFPRISMFPETKSRETLRFSGNKIHCSPRDQSLSV